MVLLHIKSSKYEKFVKKYETLKKYKNKKNRSRVEGLFGMKPLPRGC